jgi:cytochrome P450
VAPETEFTDPFAAARTDAGVLVADFAGERIPMILGHKALRQAARDWQTFSSDAPCRVPIPSEEAVRSVRQLPIEADPPLHTAFRALVKPFFMRPLQPAYIARIDALVAELLDAAVARDTVEVVREFALPLQSRALTYLLDMPETAAAEWIGWGTHVFRDGDDESAKGSALDRYIRRTIEAAQADPGEGFFSAMTRMTYDGRPLTTDEMIGIANLTFAGGRDTIINAVSVILAYFAAHREELEGIWRDAKRVNSASEEFVRIISPLTHIGRVCPAPTTVGSVAVAAGERVSLCWASGNYDESVFPDPTRIRLDRPTNPHLGFGAGHHNCLGAAQARTILRSLIRQLGERTRAIQVLAAERALEETPQYRRWVGYRSLHVRID